MTKTEKLQQLSQVRVQLLGSYYDAQLKLESAKEDLKAVNTAIAQLAEVEVPEVPDGAE